MDKVNNKWFKTHGFKKTEINNTVPDGTRAIVIEKTIDYTKMYKKNKDWKLLRYGHHIRITKFKWGDYKIRNYYYIYASGNRFEINKNISYKNFTVDEVESIMKLIGME